MSPASHIPHGGEQGQGEPKGEKNAFRSRKRFQTQSSFFRLKSLCEICLWYAARTQNTGLHLKEGRGIFRQGVQTKQKNQVH